MNISQVETITGITKQNIRFYEKEGLIQPKRNEINGYREYDEKNVKDLKLIRILRKTGMPLDDIRQILNGSKSLKEASELRIIQVEKERAELLNVLKLCDELKKDNVDEINVDDYLAFIEKEEKKGNKFYQLIEDYKQVSRHEAQKKFMFIPDDIINTPSEFTKALLKYAKDQKMDITITKEGMYPEFILDGIEYSAMRLHGRYGSTIHCEMMYPEQEEPKGIERRRKSVLKMIVHLIPLILWETLLFLGTRLMWGNDSIAGTLLAMCIFAFAYLINMYFTFYRD